ncbi:Ba176 [Baboon cytomegalovirus]|nr:Ba176 [Baboon cytomegalovirus]
MDNVIWIMDFISTFIHTTLCIVFLAAVFTGLGLYMFNKFYTTLSPRRYRPPLWSGRLKYRVCRESPRRRFGFPELRRQDSSKKAKDAKGSAEQKLGDDNDLAAPKAKKKASLCTRLFCRSKTKRSSKTTEKATTITTTRECRNQKGRSEGSKVLAVGTARSSLPPRPPRPPPPRRPAPQLATLCGL